MKPNTKRIITGVAKTTGKYTLKGLGKGAECLSKGTVKVVGAAAKSPTVQKIATGAAMIGATVAFPAIALPAVTGLWAKYMLERHILGKNTSIGDQINGILNTGTRVTRAACNKVLCPMLKKAERGIERNRSELPNCG